MIKNDIKKLLIIFWPLIKIKQNFMNNVTKLKKRKKKKLNYIIKRSSIIKFNFIWKV